MKKRLILSITILLTVVIILLTSCGTDDTTPPEETNIADTSVEMATAPVDTTTETPADTIVPQDTTSADTSPVFDESNYDLYGGLVCKGSIKEILDTYRPDDRLGFVGIAGSDLFVRAFAITQADWYENTEQELAQKGYSLKTSDFDVTKYDSTYFESKILLMIHIVAPSDAVSYDISIAKHHLYDPEILMDIVKTDSNTIPKFDTIDYVYFLETVRPYYPTIDLIPINYYYIDKTTDTTSPENALLDLRAGMVWHGGLKDVMENISSLDGYMGGNQATYGLGGIFKRYYLRTYAITQADWCEIPDGSYIDTPGFDMAKYGDEYFKDNYLIMIRMAVSSVDHANSIYNVSLTNTDDTTAYIDIEYIKDPSGAFPSDNVYIQLYFIEVKKPANSEYHMVEYNFYTK